MVVSASFLNMVGRVPYQFRTVCVSLSHPFLANFIILIGRREKVNSDVEVMIMKVGAIYEPVHLATLFEYGSIQWCNTPYCVVVFLPNGSRTAHTQQTTETF